MYLLCCSNVPLSAVAHGSVKGLHFFLSFFQQIRNFISDRLVFSIQSYLVVKTHWLRQTRKQESLQSWVGRDNSPVKSSWPVAERFKEYVSKQIQHEKENQGKGKSCQPAINGKHNCCGLWSFNGRIIVHLSSTSVFYVKGAHRLNWVYYMPSPHLIQMISIAQADRLNQGGTKYLRSRHTEILTPLLKLLFVIGPLFRLGPHKQQRQRKELGQQF